MTTYSPHFRRSFGFTLVELLVVVGIIGLLAVLLFPVAQSALRRADMASDINRLQQIGAALAMYTSEFNALPNQGSKIPGTETTPGQGDRWTFLEAVDRYMPPDRSFNPNSIYNWMRRPVWFSPSARAYPGFTVPTAANAIRQPVAFAYNPNVDNVANWNGNLARIPKRSEIVIMAEGNEAQGHRLDPSVRAVTQRNVRTAYRTSHPAGQGLYLFCDFHVEARKGDLGYSYFATNSSVPNMWRWW